MGKKKIYSVRVINSSSRWYWYKEFIDDVFKVKEWDDITWVVVGECDSWSISKVDCEFVVEPVHKIYKHKF
jgi:hypothetical protein